ncbi:MAG: hypothetical protein J1D77_01255 [Muribaculaceae bacterium]|nr:hypothetical protein [Muribaculaceae bacterium]
MKKFLYITISLIFLCIGCSGEDQPGGKADMNEGEVKEVGIQLLSRAEAPGMDDLEPGEAKAIVTDDSFFTPGSILYISQMGSDNNSNPNFSNPDENASPYMYQYEFYENEAADWDEGYNFEAVTGRKSIDWRAVKNLGSVGTAFSFFAMYFPESESPIFYVNSDQTGAGDKPYDQTRFKQSDILGANHATDALFTRMNFRLFHLMTYLKVTLYVPVYKETVVGDNMSYSGFEPGALTGAYLLGGSTQFNIEWRANRSPDTEAPLVQSGTTSTPIKMYMHQQEEDDQSITINVGDYYQDSEDPTDEVAAYNFSVLFPQPSANANVQLCFPITSKDGNVKYYYFYTNNVITSTGKLNLVQGTLQQLYLYLPRKVNETILVGAKILPWGTSSSDMTVYEEE